jgi:hypothetical protein
MNGALILLLAIVTPYFAVNLRRLYKGRPWALGVCTLAKEWEQREHDKRIARRTTNRV